MCVGHDLPIFLNGFAIVFFMTWLSVIDFLKHRLPNKVIAAWLICRLLFIIILAVTERSPEVILNSVSGAFIIGAALLTIRVLDKKVLGGGDVKLGFSIGFALTLIPAFYAIVLGFVFGAGFAVLRMLFRSNNRKTPLPIGFFWFAGIIVVHFTL